MIDRMNKVANVYININLKDYLKNPHIVIYINNNRKRKKFLSLSSYITTKNIYGHLLSYNSFYKKLEQLDD